MSRPVLLLPLQLWYFWRRRLFIWISFMDSYFEILLYVWPHTSPVSCLGEGTRWALGVRNLGQGAPGGWEQLTGQTPESGGCPVRALSMVVTSTEPSLCTSGA